MAEIMTLEDARAVAAILRAAETGAPVARLNATRDLVRIGRACYIGGRAQLAPGYAAEQQADVRDLYLHATNPAYSVREALGPETAYHIAHFSWPIRDLVAEYRTGAFVTYFDRDAFEAAGGQAAVPASVAAHKTASARSAGKPGRDRLYRTYDAYGNEVTPIGIQTAIYQRDRELLTAAREWIEDVFGGEIITGNSNDPVTKAMIRDMIRGHYAGGWAQFLRDNS